jgi:hypothetical protein
MSVVVRSVVSVSFLLAVTAAPARADWLITPYLGSAFGGDTSSQHVTYGGSAAWMSHGIIGVEFDASFAPDLLDEDDGVILGIADSNATTLMGSIVIGAPFGAPGVRPYAVAGAGLIKTRVADADDVRTWASAATCATSAEFATTTRGAESTSSSAASTSGGRRSAPRSGSNFKEDPQ